MKTKNGQRKPTTAEVLIIELSALRDHLDAILEKLCTQKAMKAIAKAPAAKKAKTSAAAKKPDAKRTQKAMIDQKTGVRYSGYGRPPAGYDKRRAVPA